MRWMIIVMLFASTAAAQTTHPFQTMVQEVDTLHQEVARLNAEVASLRAQLTTRPAEAPKFAPTGADALAEKVAQLAAAKAALAKTEDTIAKAKADALAEFSKTDASTKLNDQITQAQADFDKVDILGRPEERIKARAQVLNCKRALEDATAAYVGNDPHVVAALDQRSACIADIARLSDAIAKDPVNIGLTSKKIVAGMTVEQVDTITGYPGHKISQMDNMEQWVWRLPETVNVLDNAAPWTGNYSLHVSFRNHQAFAWERE